MATGLILSVASFAGGLLGAILAKRVSNLRLRRIFVVAVIVMALKALLFDAPWATCSSIIMNKPGSCVVALSLYALPIAAQNDGADLALLTCNAGPRWTSEVTKAWASVTVWQAIIFTCSDRGVIEVESNSPDDDASKEAIRRHMQKIAGMFARGDFSLPSLSTTQFRQAWKQ